MGIIILIGIVTGVSLSKYSKVGERTTIDRKGACNEYVNENANEHACGNNNPKNSLSLENSGLQIDVLKEGNVNKEVLHIYSK